MATNNSTIEQLISQMHKEDARQRRLAMVLRWLYIVLGVPYIIRFVVLPDADMTISDRLSGTLMGAGLLIFAVVFWLQHRQLKSLDYSQPILTFLRSSVSRYRFFQPRIISVLLAAAFVGAGVSMRLLEEQPEGFTTMQWVVTMQVIWWAVLAVSLGIGYLVWRHRTRPLWLGIKRVLQEVKE
ncbi:MAG: hypothetical protein ACQESM_10020 [Bacteroidota bacterium]